MINSFKNMDLELYSEKLDNGLEVYIVKTPNINNKYVTFSTKYGSIHKDFIPYNENKIKELPLGIAHFLEHKLFEQKNKIDPFTFYSEHGCDANANTSNFKTTYLFSGTQFYLEGLDYLLDYVQDPYFTDSNVEKEKGIILQELNMYQDDPYSVIYEKLLYNTFNNHPIRYPIIGTKKDIDKITKEDLYTCYNTFYNPSNMFLVITGDVDVNDTMERIKDNQSKKTFNSPFDIKVKDYIEDDDVYKGYEEVKMDVNIPKIGVSFKINTSNINMDLKKLYVYISILFDLLYDSTSILNEKLMDDNVITEDLSLTSVSTDKHLAVMIFTESKQTDYVIEKIVSEVSNINISEEDLERKKRVYISSLIYSSDNIYSINHKIMNDLVKYNKVYCDTYDMINSLNIKEFKDVINKLSFENVCSLVISGK